MRKLLFVALLASCAGLAVSFVEGATLKERMGSCLAETKKKIQTAYKSVGGTRGIADGIKKHVAPLGAKIKTGTQHISSKINEMAAKKVLPKAKQVYADIKEKINGEKEKRENKNTLPVAPEEKKPEEELEDRTNHNENEEMDAKQFEELFRSILAELSKKEAEHADKEHREESSQQAQDSGTEEEPEGAPSREEELLKEDL